MDAKKVEILVENLDNAIENLKKGKVVTCDTTLRVVRNYLSGYLAGTNRE